jgi:hypothetical protein
VLRPWMGKVNEETGFELDSSGDSLPSIHGTTGTDYNLS